MYEFEITYCLTLNTSVMDESFLYKDCMESSFRVLSSIKNDYIRMFEKLHSCKLNIHLKY